MFLPPFWLLEKQHFTKQLGSDKRFDGGLDGRPHPWGLLITFIELIKNGRYQFWQLVLQNLGLFQGDPQSSPWEEQKNWSIFEETLQIEGICFVQQLGTFSSRSLAADCHHFPSKMAM